MVKPTLQKTAKIIAQEFGGLETTSRAGLNEKKANDFLRVGDTTVTAEIKTSLGDIT